MTKQLSKAAVNAHISLLDLNNQLPFDIDAKLKTELCFGETLIISCTHYEGKVPDDNDVGEEQESEWTCTESSSSQVSEEVKTEPYEIKDYEEEPESEESIKDDDDFHFYFFPDCNKPPVPQHSLQSVVLVDGMPKVNELFKLPSYCTCDKDKKNVCECHVIIPCKCGAKKKNQCTCSKVENVCTCFGEPNLTCICDKHDVCTCFGLPRPDCICDTVEKPCTCEKDKFPKPVCDCKHKPKIYSSESTASYGEWKGEEEGELNESEMSQRTEKSGSEESSSTNRGSERSKDTKKGLDHGKERRHKIIEEEDQPCVCQKPDPRPNCLCLKGKKCICFEDACICGVQKTCVCEPTETKYELCKSVSKDSKIICECPNPKECTCEAKGNDCQCFPTKHVCTCGDPENCKCLKICDCTEPCICDTLQQDDECNCLDKNKLEVCTCPCKEEDIPTKLKKVRAGKEGYRWCHDVDPYHTFFDYAYGRHDKIDIKVQEKEKLKITGLYDEKEDACPIHGKAGHSFQKNVRKPSLDCCSAVGGITISVEVVGEESDKFLVQVVSHSSKEGAKTGTKLVSIVDMNLHTLEENRAEHIVKKERIKERKNYMAICENGYYNKVTRICGDRNVVKRLYHNFEQAHDFLLEGANVVLLRYFGLRRYKGSVKTLTVLMDGTVCESIYVCPGVSQAIVNGTPLFVVKVERHIIEPSGFVHQTLTVLSLRGYIISHEWADNSYVMHLNPLLKVIPEKDQIEQHAPLRDRWREDLQLLSDYLDFKASRSSEGARYVAESGTLTNTVKDYLQTILLLKPADVLHFTRHYFNSALSAIDLPHDEFFDPCPRHVRYFYFEE